MAPDETAKPTEPTPEAPKAEEPTAAAPAEEPKPAEPAAAAAPPADPVKQMGDAAHQASESIDKSLSGMKPQDRFILVFVVSLFFAWLGDILNGQIMKGVVVLGIAIVLGFLIPFTLGLSFLLLGVLHIAAAIDAIVIANRISKGEKFSDWEFFWKPAPPAA